MLICQVSVWCFFCFLALSSRGGFYQLLRKRVFLRTGSSVLPILLVSGLLLSGARRVFSASSWYRPKFFKFAPVTHFSVLFAYFLYPIAFQFSSSWYFCIPHYFPLPNYTAALCTPLYQFFYFAQYSPLKWPEYPMRGAQGVLFLLRGGLSIHFSAPIWQVY